MMKSTPRMNNQQHTPLNAIHARATQHAPKKSLPERPLASTRCTSRTPFPMFVRSPPSFFFSPARCPFFRRWKCSLPSCGCNVTNKAKLRCLTGRGRAYLSAPRSGCLGWLCPSQSSEAVARLAIAELNQ